jgi:hypothetical protein
MILFCWYCGFCFLFSPSFDKREKTWYLSYETSLFHLTWGSQYYLVPRKYIISFFFMDEQNSIVYIFHILFIHSLIGGLLGWLHNLVTVNWWVSLFSELEKRSACCAGKWRSRFGPTILKLRHPKQNY